MTFMQTQSESFGGLDAFDEPAREETGAPEPVRATSYHAVLLEPTTSLVGGTIDRPEVAAVAILGYN
ncbi:TPA: hypothetical protein SAY52_004259 [Burkholderia cenocepacia]|uniref:hypothetical protein n=1 Tax=unclassified Burkholderia TaxID=2613784 RepID=UPI00158C864E|nr:MULTISPECIES: hypothetical protein [unclassified Burkholderia]HEF5873603.1 hypothetical protein [Burkholderia cenocepacia]